MSGASLVVSLAALGLAVQALNTANDKPITNAVTVSGGGVTSTSGVSDPTSSSPIVADSNDTATLPSEDITPTIPPATATYTLSYQDQQLRLRPNNGCGGRMVDLDQPAVNVAGELSDMEYRAGCGNSGPILRFASDKVATVTSANATPNDCGEAIQLSPSSQDIKPSQDLVICELSNGVGAPNEPARAKMVRLVVTGVGRDESVTLTATSWEIPH